MTAAPKHDYTPGEYLAFERQSDSRHEYFAGEIFAMGGSSERHVLIVANVSGSLWTQLKGRPCKVYPTDMRVKASRTGLHTYPDVSVVCGEALFDDAQFDSLLNPQTIIEVLSPSTQAYDRGAKFEHYRRIESLGDYVLIAQHARHVEHHSRQPHGSWICTEANQPEDMIRLASIGCELKLADIYDKILFNES